MEKPTSDCHAAEPASETRTAFNPFLDLGVLNETLRQQLTPAQSPSHADRSDKRNTGFDAVETAVAAAAEMLRPDLPDRASLDSRLDALYEAWTGVYQAAAIPHNLRKRQYVFRHGVVLSPDNCVTSVRDTMRMRSFARGIDLALEQLQQRFNPDGDSPLHVVYPACGPFAPLLLPLLAYYRRQRRFTPSELQVTLIDIQPGAAMSLNALARALEVEDYIGEIRCQDGVDYRKTGPVHLVVLEAMQHGFSREAHLMLAQHFARLLEPGGEFIPRRISITAALNAGQREFVDQWRGAGYCRAAHIDPAVLAERTRLGEILTITPQTLRELTVQQLDDHTALLECGSVRIPDKLQHPERQLLMLCSYIHTFADEHIEEYDSGITHPLPDEQVCVDFQPDQPLPGDLAVHRGDTLKFYYRVNGLPGFFAVKK